MRDVKRSDTVPPSGRIPSSETRAEDEPVQVQVPRIFSPFCSASKRDAAEVSDGGSENETETAADALSPFRVNDSGESSAVRGAAMNENG